MTLIDFKHSGLPCRAPGRCKQVFYPAVDNTLDALNAAVLQRNAHEVAEHAYAHVVVATWATWDFSTPMSRRGQSLLKMKRKQQANASR